MSKAGKEPEVEIGSEHPSPDTIPHSNPNAGSSSSPVKESPLVPDAAAAADQKDTGNKEPTVTARPTQDTISQ